MTEEGQLMKFKIEDNKLKMEIKITDLLYLFKTSEANFDGEKGQIAKVKKECKEQFANYIIEYLKGPSYDNENISNWAEPFERAFYEIVEGYEEFCKYKEV